VYKPVQRRAVGSRAPGPAQSLWCASRSRAAASVRMLAGCVHLRACAVWTSFGVQVSALGIRYSVVAGSRNLDTDRIGFAL